MALLLTHGAISRRWGDPGSAERFQSLLGAEAAKEKDATLGLALGSQSGGNVGEPNSMVR